MHLKHEMSPQFAQIIEHQVAAKKAVFSSLHQATSFVINKTLMQIKPENTMS